LPKETAEWLISDAEDLYKVVFNKIFQLNFMMCEVDVFLILREESRAGMPAISDLNRKIFWQQL
jgi:hypothetical protein